MPAALLTGVAGQDGVLLTNALRRRGWHVVGLTRPGPRLEAAAPYLVGVPVVEADVRDTAAVLGAIDEHRIDAVVNLAAISSVGLSWQQPDLVRAVNAESVTALLAALAERDRAPRLLQASSAEIFGPGGPHAEDAPIAPVNPYGEAKAAAHRAVAAARADGLWTCSAVLFNHESPLRGRGFVTRKISAGVAAIALGRQETLTLGPLDVRRDWSSAHEVVEAMALVLERDEPVDLVLASGRATALATFVEEAFAAAGVGDPWDRVRVDETLRRPTDPAVTVGDPTRAHDVLGWRARTDVAGLARRMVEIDRRRLETGVEECPDYAL